MTDLVSIGALAAAALSMAAEPFLKGVLGEAGKSAFNALKDKVSAWAGGDVEALEKAII